MEEKRLWRECKVILALLLVQTRALVAGKTVKHGAHMMMQADQLQGETPFAVVKAPRFATILIPSSVT